LYLFFDYLPGTDVFISFCCLMTKEYDYKAVQSVLADWFDSSGDENGSHLLRFCPFEAIL